MSRGKKWPRYVWGKEIAGLWIFGKMREQEIGAVRFFQRSGERGCDR